MQVHTENNTNRAHQLAYTRWNFCSPKAVIQNRCGEFALKTAAKKSMIPC